MAAAVLPNDPFFSANQASYLEQVRIPEAWAKTTGSEDVIIAVIDSGVDTDHPDIIANMWFNRGEIPLNGIDDDANGYVDDLNGWDFLENTSDPHPKFTGAYSFEGINHGTIVAGIAAASTNNNEGLAGVCWNCKIMALRAVAGDGAGTTADVAKAIQYAIDNGADIINMSFVGALTDEILNNTIKKAYDAGIVLVAAVGNDAANDFLIGGDLDFRPLFPVCADGGANHIIGVGSVDKDNRKSSFSNFGFHCIDINAPGNGLAGPQVFDPRQGGKFDDKYRAGWRGTSMSTPIVAGVAGLVKSINPRLSNDQVIAIIRQTGQDITSENPFYLAQLGGGLLDAREAVQLASETPGLGPEKKDNQKIINTRREILTTPFSNRKAEIISFSQARGVKTSFLAFPQSFRGGAAVASADVDGDGSREIIVAPGSAGSSQIRIFTAGGKLKSQFFAFGSKYRGGVQLAAADVDGDGQDEIIVSAKNQKNAQIKIFNYQGQERYNFALSKPNLIESLPLAAADIDHDGQAEIIVGSSRGSLPEVQIFDRLGNKASSFLAYPKSFRGGVRLAAGDVDNDGQVEIVVSPIQGGPQIRIFTPDGILKGQFFAFEKTGRTGALAAVGNVDDDPAAEIIVGAGVGQEADVRVFSKFGADWSQDSVFAVFEPGFKGGVNVGL